MNASRSSYVEYGTGNMLNLDAGTIKRKIDSNEYDDEIIQEAQVRTAALVGYYSQPLSFVTLLGRSHYRFFGFIFSQMESEPAVSHPMPTSLRPLANTWSPRRPPMVKSKLTPPGRPLNRTRRPCFGPLSPLALRAL